HFFIFKLKIFLDLAFFFARFLLFSTLLFFASSKELKNNQSLANDGVSIPMEMSF
ncbi:hypothetical protein HPHPH9_1418, partial [Helicobacter pylori Hp H-9]